jgi:hypothetical protein
MRLAISLSSLARSCWARSSNSIVEAEVAHGLAERDAFDGSEEALLGAPDVMKVFEIGEECLANEVVLGFAGPLR